MGRAALGRCVDGAGRGGSRRNRGPAGSRRSGAPRRPSRSWAATVPPGHQRMRGCAWRRRSSATLAGIHRSTAVVAAFWDRLLGRARAGRRRASRCNISGRGQPEGDRRQALRVAGVPAPRVSRCWRSRSLGPTTPFSTTHGCLCELHRRGRQRRHVQRLRRDRLGRGDRAGQVTLYPAELRAGRPGRRRRGRGPARHDPRGPARTDRHPSLTGRPSQPTS